MKNRDAFLAGTAAGAIIGGLSWYIARQMTEVGPVEMLGPGEPFPTITGNTLDGERLTLPDDQLGKVQLLVVAFSYDARFEVEEWSHFIAGSFGADPNLDFYLVPMISGVGALMRRSIDAAMTRGTPAEERSHVFTVYGDLRWLRKRLGIGRGPRAYLFLLGRTGRLAWSVEGPATDENRAALRAALATQGVGPQEV